MANISSWYCRCLPRDMILKGAFVLATRCTEELTEKTQKGRKEKPILRLKPGTVTDALKKARRQLVLSAEQAVLMPENLKPKSAPERTLRSSTTIYLRPIRLVVDKPCFEKCPKIRE